MLSLLHRHTIGNVKLITEYEPGVSEKPRMEILIWKFTSTLSSKDSYT